MGLLNVLRSAIKTADGITKDLQPIVTYKRAVDDGTGTGTFTYPSAVPLRAIVDFKAKPVTTREGVLTVTSATMDFLDLAEVAAATSGLGFGYDDRFILPNGKTGPVLSIAGFMDRETGGPLPTTVMIG